MPVDRHELDVVLAVRHVASPGRTSSDDSTTRYPGVAQPADPLDLPGFYTDCHVRAGPLASQRDSDDGPRLRTSGPPTHSSGRPARSAPPRWPGWSSDLPWFRELQRRGPVLGGPDRPGRHPGVRRLVPPGRRRARARRQRDGRLRLRRRAARPGRRHHPPADRRPGPALDRGRRGQHRRAARPRRRPPTCTPPCCATPARSRSRPPRSTPAPPRCAAPGTPGSRRWSSTPCCAPRPTRPLLSRASALGWAGRGDVAVVLGAVPGRPHARPTSSTRYAGPPGPPAWTRSARSRATGWSSCSAGSTDPRAAAEAVADLFGDGPGRGRPGRRRPRARPTSPPAPRCRRTGPPRAGRRRPGRCAAATCCPSGPWPATATPAASWSRRSTCRWLQARGTLIETLAAYFQHGSSIEATARALFVHPNTVRYRLRQVAELTGFSPTDARDAFTLEIALVLGSPVRASSL